MFVRFRETAYRLQCSLVETRRIGRNVRHEHIAMLGSVEVPLTVEGRLAFWQKLHERLAKLGNRLDAAAQGKVMAAVHARIPMAMTDEQRALQLQNAEADERVWSSLRDISQEQADDHKALAAEAERVAANSQAAADNAAANATAAKARIEAIKRGENVEGGLGKPVDFEQALRAAGLTDERMQDCRRMHELFTFAEAVIGDKKRAHEAVHKEFHAALERTYRATARRLHAEWQVLADDCRDDGEEAG
jgi:hypothetical protein